MKKILEIQTPLNTEIDDFIAHLAQRDDTDTIMLEEGGGLSVIIVAEKLRRICDKEIILKIACRDRNRIALHSQIITAGAAGFTKLLLVDGVHPIRTTFPEAKPVYELDSLGLLRMIKQGSPGFGDGIDSLPTGAYWTIAACIGGATPADMARAKKFLEAGADMLFTHSLDSLPRLKRLTEYPIILSITEGETAADLEESIQKAEAAGASGINIEVRALEKASDGDIAAR